MPILETSTISHIEGLKIGELTWNPLPAEFLTALKLCRMPGNSTPLRGVFFDGKDVYSTDSVRINHYTMASEVSCFWIEDSAVSELIRFDGLSDVAVSPAWVHFKGEDGTIFSARNRETSGFPKDKLSGLLNTSGPAPEDIRGNLPKALTDVVSRAMVFGTEMRGAMVIGLSLFQNHLTIKAQRDAGSYVEELDWETPLSTDPGIEIFVDSSFLQEASGKVEEFYIKTINGARTLIFESAEYRQIAATVVLPAKTAAKGKTKK
jgi:hypothetical protein